MQLILARSPGRRPLRAFLAMSCNTIISWVFLKNAGTVILTIVIVLWWLSSYPTMDPPAESIALHEKAALIATTDVEKSEQLEAEADAIASTSQLAGSFAGQIGQFVEPVFRPLGYDWKLSIGVMTSFAAREVFVSTIAVLSAGSEAVEDDGILTKIKNSKRADGSPLFDVPTSASLLVFFVLAMQCLPTIVVTRRETGSWNWALLQLGYMTVLAWVFSFATYTLIGMVMS